MASGAWASQTENSTRPIAMTTISHHGNAFTNMPRQSGAPSGNPSSYHEPPPISYREPTSRAREPPRHRPASEPPPRPRRQSYVPLCDPHFRLPWIELGVGLLCALISLCLMIAGLSRGSVVGEDSVKTRNYSAVYVGIFFLLVAIGLIVAFAMHFMKVKRRLEYREIERPTESRVSGSEADQIRARESYMADNLAFSEEPARRPAKTDPRIPDPTCVTKDKAYLSQAQTSQTFHATAYSRSVIEDRQLPVSNTYTPQQTVQNPHYPVDPKNRASGYNYRSTNQENPLSYPDMSRVRSDGGMKSTDRPPPTYIGGSEHSSPPPSYRTYSSEPQPMIPSSILSTVQQRAIIERRQQRVGQSRCSPSSIGIKVDVEMHRYN